MSWFDGVIFYEKFPFPNISKFAFSIMLLEYGVHRSIQTKQGSQPETVVDMRS